MNQMGPKGTKIKIPGSGGFAFSAVLLVIGSIALLLRRKRYEGATSADVPLTIIHASDCDPALAASDCEPTPAASGCEPVPAASAPPPPKETKTLASAEYDSRDIDELIKRLIAALLKNRRYFGFPGKERTAIVKVSNVSLDATERDIKELFDYCGGIKSVEMQGDTEMSQIAYVTFRHIRGAETAVLLSGAIIVDKPVTITPAPKYFLLPSLKLIRSEESRLMNCLSSLPILDRKAYENFREEVSDRLNEIESGKRWI